MVEDLLDEQSRTISVLWSEDSSRFVCWVQQARFTAFIVYGHQKNSFETLSIPEIEMPFESSLKGKESRCIGGFDCSYDITIHFDKQGKGSVVKIKKMPIRH